jgi:hypothetical protein
MYACNRIETCIYSGGRHKIREIKNTKDMLKPESGGMTHRLLSFSFSSRAPWSSPSWESSTKATQKKLLMQQPGGEKLVRCVVGSTRTVMVLSMDAFCRMCVELTALLLQDLEGDALMLFCGETGSCLHSAMRNK